MYMSDPLDFNINNYSIAELYQLLELKKSATSKEIKRRTDKYIEKYTKEGLPNYYNFFVEARNKLLDDKESEEEDDGGGEFIKTEYAPKSDADDESCQSQRLYADCGVRA